MIEGTENFKINPQNSRTISGTKSIESASRVLRNKEEHAYIQPLLLVNSVSIDSNHPCLPPGDWGLCGAAHLQSLPPRPGKNTRSWWSSGLIWKGVLCSFVSLLWLGPCTCYTNNQYIQYILGTTLYTLQSGSAQSSCCCIRSQQ